MYTVHFEKEVALSRKKVRDCLTDIAQYPRHIAFVKEVIAPDPLHPGNAWHDITTLLWVPMSIKHEIHKMGQDELIFRLSGRGIRYEQENIRMISLSPQRTRVIMDIVFDLHPVLNITLGKLVQKRLYRMLELTVVKMENLYGQIFVCSPNL